MTQTIFWELIDNSVDNCANQEAQYEYLLMKLSEMSPDDIIKFELIQSALHWQLYRTGILCAAMVMKDYVSDDGFGNFCWWLLSRGKEVYENAIINPDSLIDDIVGINEDTYFDFEEFRYISLIAFENLTGKEIYESIERDKIDISELELEVKKKVRITWNPRISTIKRYCPNLYLKRIIDNEMKSNNSYVHVGTVLPG